jgi:hypothetical protein
VVSRITAAVGDKVPELVSRISRILRHASFRESLNSSCVDMLETDALGLLRQKNQGLRRAIKVAGRSFLISALLHTCHVCRTYLYARIHTSKNNFLASPLPNMTDLPVLT